MVWCGEEFRSETSVRATGQHTSDQVQCHRADDGTVFPGEGLERAVGQSDRLPVGVRLEALFGEDL
jgi:hypothetical protein